MITNFGCGKSYPTFVMYCYLKVLKEHPVHIIGLDLKRDVIDHCSSLGRQYGYNRLDFYHGSIASYQGVDRVDMVVAPHVCDTATDYALEKAVDWGVKVVPSVPCCQRKLAKQVEDNLTEPVLQYGPIRERMTTFCTDAIRGQVLEYRGYRTQTLEFIDMGHTPKNILIRVILQGKKKDNGSRIRELMELMGIGPITVKLLTPEFLDSEPLPPKPLVL